MALALKLPKIVHILGCVGGLAAGVVAIFIGATNSSARGAIPIGVAFLAAAIVGIVAGAKASPTGSLSPSVGGKFTAVPDWAVFVVGGILVAGFIVGFIVGVG